MCTVNTAPTATITAPTANRTITAGTSVSFTGTASDPDGNTITNYEWRVGSCTGTLLSSSSSFSYTFSNVGTYNIYFRAYDGCTWSACQSRTITVNAGTSGSTGSCTKNLVYMPVTIGGGPNDCRGVGCVGMSEGQSCSSEGSGCMVACTEMSGVQLLVCMDPACSYDIYNRTVSCPPCSCTGSIPTNNATMCTGDSTTTAALPWQNVPLNGCTTRKCEFFCDSGYNYNPATNTCAPIIRGSCGTNAQTYSYDATAYPGTSFCLTGTASPASPAFPSEGNSVTWTCSGGDNTISTDDVNCSATRNNARSCAIPWSTTGETVTSGNALTVYPSATVPCGSTCAPQYRLCVDGTLESGSSIVRCEPEDCPNPPSYSSWKEVRP